MTHRSIIAAGVVVGVIAAGFAGWKYVAPMIRSRALPRLAVSSLTRTALNNPAEREIIPGLLGFNGPRRYLILFLNNTELRPGGGFIGAYGIVEFANGRPRVEKVEGTETLDRAAASTTLPRPPAPLAEYLHVERWYFRDGNWSPDFASSSAHALDLYRREAGDKAGKIDGVIGFTPTVIEELLKIIGPVTVGGQTFTSQNFTEKLEYEVEYGYRKRGVSLSERKQLIAEIGAVLIDRLSGGLWRRYQAYLSLADRMLTEKQLVLYASDSKIEEMIRARGWAGEMRWPRGDYLLWADANLGALKTDAAIERSLTYRIFKTGGGYAAEARMNFWHRGQFDWRTSRYRDYARVFVPPGSALIEARGAMKADKNPAAGPISQGKEGGHAWFGAFISIEPGAKGELVFRYRLDPAVAANIKAGQYHLTVQKQPGTIATPLTLGLEFDTTVTAVAPGEALERQGDSAYAIKTDLRVDREFKVQLKSE